MLINLSFEPGNKFDSNTLIANVLDEPGLPTTMVGVLVTIPHKLTHVISSSERLNSTTNRAVSTFSITITNV